MDRVSPMALIGLKKLDYDLYDENGTLLYKSGDELTSEILLSLNYKAVYKESQDTSQVENNTLINLTGKELKSIFPEKTTRLLMSNTRKLVQQAFETNALDMEICQDTRDIILNEVYEKADVFESIGQFRIIDEYTFSHRVNVSALSSALGLKLNLSENELKELALGTLLHDVGKLRVPPSILNKPGKLTPEEFEIIKTHTTLGYKVVREEMGLAENIALIALQHQEKYGGGGYPFGLKGNDISYYAQITSVIDVYDALVSKRVYKEALPSHEALRVLIDEGSKSFNPVLLYKFIYFANYKNAVDFKIVDRKEQIVSV